MTDAQGLRVGDLLKERTILEAHHGDCVGSDAQFHRICLILRIPVVIHPPTNENKRAHCAGATLILPTEEYLVRNEHIVLASSCLIATPGELIEQQRSGTWATIRRARKKSGLDLIIVFPTGATETWTDISRLSR